MKFTGKKMLQLIAAMSIIILTGCNDDLKTRISGVIENTDNDTMTIYFKDPLDSPRGVNDSSAINRNGKFSFEFRSHKVQFVEVIYNGQKILLIARPGEKIKIRSKHENFANEYAVTGSEESEKVRELDMKLNNTLNAVDSLSSVYGDTMDEAEIKELNLKVDSIFKQHKKFIQGFILNDLKSLSNIVAIYQRFDGNTYFLNTLRDLQLYKLVNDTLQKYYPNISYVQMHNRNTMDMIAKYNASVLMSNTQLIETALPEIKLPDKNNDTIALSLVECKYLYLCFWDPKSEGNREFCRNLINLYNKFKNKGLEIFLVSFEPDHKGWRTMVEFEEFPWICVNDINGAISGYKSIYNVAQLPASYLMDKSKESIIGKDMPPWQLELKLNYLINEK